MNNTIFIETSHFNDFGGWVLDQQFIAQMFNPYLLAHGLGEPVADAVSKVRVGYPGTYHVWCRTKNWASIIPNEVSPTESPGRFNLIFDHVPLNHDFGTESSEWAWEYGGTIALDLDTEIRLHDLTGFDGRCDAIVLSTSPTIELPNTKDEFKHFRKAYGNHKENEERLYDFVVVGAGVAGICAAVAAARMGLSVALIHDRDILGGNNSSEVRVQLGGKVNLPPFEAIGNVVNEIDHHSNRNARPAEEYRDDLKWKIVSEEKNIDLFISTYVDEVQLDESVIESISARNLKNGQVTRFIAPLFSDCSGDAILGYLAGAEFRMGRESFNETKESIAPQREDQMTLGTSVMWYSEETADDQQFPLTPWALHFTDETCQKAKKGDWDWEAGIGRNHIDEFEFIRDYSLLAIYGNWSYLKNFSFLKDEYRKRKLEWVAYIGGKRESRRLMGDIVISQHDIDNKVKYEDACVTTSWSIDLHEPKIIEGFEHESFRARAKKARVEPFSIPYRALYSKNIPNLFMAGRNISVTHVALGAVRVMKTTGMMGEVVGLAASFCIKNKVLPRQLYAKYLNEFLDVLQKGVPSKKNSQ